MTEVSFLSHLACFSEMFTTPGIHLALSFPIPTLEFWRAWTKEEGAVRESIGLWGGDSRWESQPFALRPEREREGSGGSGGGKGRMKRVATLTGQGRLGAGEAWGQTVFCLCPLFPTAPNGTSSSPRDGPGFSKRVVATSFPYLPCQLLADEPSDQNPAFNTSQCIKV